MSWKPRVLVSSGGMLSMICCICPLPPMLGYSGRYKARAPATPTVQPTSERHESARARRKTGSGLRTVGLLGGLALVGCGGAPVQAEHRLLEVGFLDREVDDPVPGDHLDDGVDVAVHRRGEPHDLSGRDDIEVAHVRELAERGAHGILGRVG